MCNGGSSKVSLNLKCSKQPSWLPHPHLVIITSIFFHSFFIFILTFCPGGLCARATKNFSHKNFFFYIYENIFKSSCCGTIGSMASWERWDEGSISGPAQRLTDLALLQLWLRLQNWGSNLIPRPGSSICWGAAKKEKKKKLYNLTRKVRNLSGQKSQLKNCFSE